MSHAEEPMDDLDTDILDRLAEVLDVIDPPPPGLADDVVFALSMQALDAELATLAEATELAVRTAGASPTDTVTFSSSALQLMVSTAEEDDDTLRIDGWVTGGGITVELIHGSDSLEAVSDAHGRLVWRHVPRGRVRFLLHPPGPEARPVLTPVIEL